MDYFFVSCPLDLGSSASVLTRPHSSTSTTARATRSTRSGLFTSTTTRPSTRLPSSRESIPVVAVAVAIANPPFPAQHPRRGLPGVPRDFLHPSCRYSSYPHELLRDVPHPLLHHRESASLSLFSARRRSAATRADVILQFTVRRDARTLGCTLLLGSPRSLGTQGVGHGSRGGGPRHSPSIVSYQGSMSSLLLVADFEFTFSFVLATAERVARTSEFAHLLPTRRAPS